FAVDWEAADGPVARRRVAELERARIGPGGLVEIVLRERIEVRPGRHCVDTAGAVWPLLAVEQQAAEIVGHGDIQRPPAFISEDAADIPTAEQHLPRTASELARAWHLPGKARQQHVRCVVGAERPWQRVSGILDDAVGAVVALSALRPVVIQLRIGVAHARLQTAREAALEPKLQRMVLAPARGNAAPIDLLILREFPERLGHIAGEAGVRQSNSGGPR